MINFSINNDAKTAEIMIYDFIGADYFTEDGSIANQCADILKQIPPDYQIECRINSEGGNVWDGVAIYNQLKRRQNVTTCCDGLALSIASVIFLAGSKRVMPENALLMIHKSWGLASGNADELIKVADRLTKHDEVLAGIYVDATGLSKDKITQMMADETWMTGKEALDLGFCTETTSVVQMAACAKDLPYRRVPEWLVGKPAATPQNEGHTVNTENAATAQPAATALPNQNAQAPAAPQAAAQPQVSTDQVSLTAIMAAINGIGDRLNKLEKPVTTVTPAGGEPIALGVQDLGSPLLKTYDGFKPGHERRAFALANLNELGRQLMKRSPQAANTIAAGLYPNIAIDGLVVIMRNKLAMLNSFTTDFRLDVMKPLVPVVVTKSTVGPTVQTNATDFRTGDSTLAAITVTPARLSATVNLTDAQINNGIQLVKEYDLAIGNLSDAVSDVVTALMTVGNFGSATVVGVAANFDSADMPAIFALAKNYARRNLLLDGSHLAGLIPQDTTKWVLGQQGAFGFDNIIMNNRWTSAVANSVGFVADPRAIVIAAGRSSEIPTRYYENISYAQIENGPEVRLVTWFDPNTQITYTCFDLMFGAAVGDGTAAECLVSA